MVKHLIILQSQRARRMWKQFFFIILTVLKLVNKFLQSDRFNLQPQIKINDLLLS